MRRTHKLPPRDYSPRPAEFGRSDHNAWTVPPGGTEAELALAVAQHQAALAVHRQQDRSAARRMALRFGFSPKTWSDYTLGKSWMSRAAFAAVVTLLLEENDGQANRGVGSGLSRRAPRRASAG